MQLKGLLAASALLAQWAQAATSVPTGDPFKVIDPQKWVNPDHMTWDDFLPPPGTNWSNPSQTGSERNFHIALVTLDYEDRPFVITQDAGSTIYGNPQPIKANVPKEDVPSYYRDLLNTPNELNGGHTLHEYWMEDSGGRFGVDLTVYGIYRMPSLSWQYGITDWMNDGSCPVKGKCDVDLREDGLGAWRADVGDDLANSYELIFILSAGQDESSTWQEFGEMKFATKEDVPDKFGPPKDVVANLTNYATTRYVNWTSWAAASNIWPDAGGGSSTQAESSGMAVFAHELSHLLNIGDNYNNPYGTPLRRAYTGPWSMMSRGSFNGPGGPHSRWQIPALQGSSMGSLHTVRDKYQLGLIEKSKILWLSRSALAESGFVIAQVTARAVQSDIMGLRIELDGGGDLSPACNVNTEVLCDGGGFNYYDVEVVDRMGADSFQPDAGVLISKSKKEGQDNAPFQWVIDANPQDIELVDFQKPDGSGSKMITLGDYRQLADAPFHAGTGSGSQYEHVDKANKLHLYVLDKLRSKDGVLSYTISARSLEAPGKSTFKVGLKEGKPVGGDAPTKQGVFCSFDLTNKGTFVEGGKHPQDVSAFVGSDVFRIEAKVEGAGWKVGVPNVFVAAKFGETVSANVAVRAEKGASRTGVVTLTATSESNGAVKATAKCRVAKR